jgi:DNA-binding transcriptional ArsR family regulator
MLNRAEGLDAVFRALADPTRRAMLERLARGEASLGELAGPLPMSLPAVHQHLAVLEEAGLVRTTKAGRMRRCRLEAGALRRAERWLAGRRVLWERRLDALARHLEERGGKR